MPYWLNEAHPPRTPRRDANLGTRRLKSSKSSNTSLWTVIQNSADDGDFPYSDWTAPYRTPAGRNATLAAHGESFDLLLGRRTYDFWSGFWPKAPSSPMADRSMRHQIYRDPLSGKS